MNVIIANKYKDMLMQLDIDVIKSIEGVYDAEEISNMFKNFFFQSMILDITAIKDYENVDNLKKLSNGIDMKKIILILDDSPEATAPHYIAKLISMGIFNFTRNKEGIKYLLQKPNTYDDVKALAEVNTPEFMPPVVETKKEKHRLFGKKEEPKNESSDLSNVEPTNFGLNNDTEISTPEFNSVEENNSEVVNTPQMENSVNTDEIIDLSNEFNTEEETPNNGSDLIDTPILEEPMVENSIDNSMEEDNNVTSDGLEELPRINTSSAVENKPFFDVGTSNDTMSDANLMENNMGDVGSKIIGVKNVSLHAGATTFIYMAYEQLKSKYEVVGIEVNKVDFSFFKDPSLISSSKAALSTEILKHRDADIIFIDLNDFGDLDICTDVLYLLEPSTIKLNRLMLKDREVFKKLKGKKIILNKSMITDKEVKEFEYEAKTKVFYNLPPINDRNLPNEKLDDLLKKIGFIR